MLLHLAEPAQFDYNQYFASDSPDRILDDTTCTLDYKYNTLLAGKLMRILKAAGP